MGEIRGEMKHMNLSPDEAAWAVWRSHGGQPSNRESIEGGPPVFKRLKSSVGGVPVRAVLCANSSPPTFSSSSDLDNMPGGRD